MSHRIALHSSVVLAVLAAALLAAGPAAAAPATAFSGRAVVVNGKVAGIPITLIDTGPVAPEGGELEQSLLCYPDGPSCAVGIADATSGAVGAQVLHAAVVAHGNTSRADASAAMFALAVAGQTIEAEFLAAEAEARCADGKAFVRGDAEIAELTVNGERIAVVGDVNERIDLPGGGFVLANEQLASAEAERGDITVRALHVVVPGVLPGTDTDLVIAEAHADIRCATPPPPCRGPEKVTGGGWVVNEGARRNFAVAGRQLEAWGHFLFVDHATGDKMKATRVDPITFDAAGFAVLTGVAEVNGRGEHSFVLKVRDGGEPGRGADQLMLTTSYAPLEQPLTTLSGGNIQFHKPCR